LFGISLLNDNLGWFITKKLVSVETAQFIPDIQKEIIKELAPESMQLIEGLGVKPWMIFAPIAKDWAKYNEDDNKGELIKARL
jgi:acyl-CoA oxidase